MTVLVTLISKIRQELSKLSSHAAGAFISSFCDSQTIIEDITGQPKNFNDEDLLDLLNSKTGETQFNMEEACASSQKAMSQVIDSNQLNELKTEMDNERDKARINCVTMKHAGDWLNTVPVKSLGLHLRPLEFTTSVKYRLGIPVFHASGPCSSDKCYWLWER